VLDRLKQSDLPSQLAGPIFLSTAIAAQTLHRDREGGYAEFI
jgi:SulP family sulfate permease